MMDGSGDVTNACTGRAYAVRRFLEVFGIHTFFDPPVMRDVALAARGDLSVGRGAG